MHLKPEYPAQQPHAGAGQRGHQAGGRGRRVEGLDAAPEEHGRPAQALVRAAQGAQRAVHGAAAVPRQEPVHAQPHAADQGQEVHGAHQARAARAQPDLQGQPGQEGGGAVGKGAGRQGGEAIHTRRLRGGWGADPGGTFALHVA
ncbi:unnamed protein product [Phytophthora fragariaefolia]|uniref:Unnamed protein product n=1 Tax=Phytophthora fragariaefolia TaxID=1490495 RepID=A0A9W6XP43_9STRA|nr:unnamed protein product [Phytophthora fragariaefolia]